MNREKLCSQTIEKRNFFVTLVLLDRLYTCKPKFYTLYILLWLIVVLVVKYVHVQTVRVTQKNDAHAMTVHVQDALVVQMHNDGYTSTTRYLCNSVAQVYICTCQLTCCGWYPSAGFLKTHQKLHTIRDASAITSWLYRIATLYTKML